MTPAQTAALTRVAKLIPNLARDNDFEVLTAARAIVRTLAGVDLDCHELARLVTAGSDRRGSPAPRAGAGPKPAPASTWPDFARDAAPRPRRSDPMFAERVQANAFKDFVPLILSEAIRQEIEPRRDDLDEKDRAFFDLASKRIRESVRLVPTVHEMLLDIAAKLRAQS